MEQYLNYYEVYVNKNHKPRAEESMSFQSNKQLKIFYDKIIKYFV